MYGHFRKVSPTATIFSSPSIASELRMADTLPPVLHLKSSCPVASLDACMGIDSRSISLICQFSACPFSLVCAKVRTPGSQDDESAHSQRALPHACSKAIATAAQRMLEEHTYFCVTYLNWQRDDAWSHYGPVWGNSICPDIPAPIRSLVMARIRGSVLRDLHGQVRTKAPAAVKCIWWLEAGFERGGLRLICVL